MKKLKFAFLLVFLQACNVDKSQKVDPDKLDFKTEESTELYFKNIRQSAYEVEENDEAGLYLYRHNAWAHTSSTVFTPVIVFNWRQDRAYTLIEWNTDRSLELPLTVETRSGEDIRELQYSEGNMTAQLHFLTGLYNAVVEGSDIFIVNESGETPLFSSDAQRQTFRIIMFDYYRLTGVF